MKNKVILVILIVVGVVIAGRTLINPPSQEDNDESPMTETHLEDYEELNTELLELIADVDSSLNVTGPDDVLSIEFFELDPENEELGDVY